MLILMQLIAYGIDPMQITEDYWKRILEVDSIKLHANTK